MRKLILALAAAGAVALAAPAAGQDGPATCAAYPEMVETLRARFGETLRLSASENRGFGLEFFANDTGSWTLVMRRDDQACAIAAGEKWESSSDKKF